MLTKELQSKDRPENEKRDELNFSLTQLQQEMNSLFARCCNSAQAYIEDWNSKRMPLINIIDGGPAFYVEAALPGLAPENVKTDVEGGMLTIRSDADAKDNARYLRREMQVGPFTRSIVLPGIIDLARISSVFKDGMLTVTLPKKQPASAMPHKPLTR